MRYLNAHIGAALMVAAATAAQAAMLTDDKGMTLYIFDKDTAGMSTCYDTCAVNWPPYLATEGQTMGEGWTQVDRTDGTKQWAFDGKPVYFFKQDTAAGEAKGDGLNGVWHVIAQ